MKGGSSNRGTTRQRARGRQGESASMGGIDQGGESGEENVKRTEQGGRHFNGGQGQVWRTGRGSSTGSWPLFDEFPITRVIRPPPREAGTVARPSAAGALGSAARVVLRHAGGSPS